MAAINFPKVSLYESLNSRQGFDLGFSAFKAKMDAFQEAMDEYVLREKEAISQSAANHTSTIRNLNADKEETEQRIEMERAREREMLDTIEAERHHLNDLQASVARLHAQLAKIRDQGSSLDNELAGVRKEVSLERATKERQVKVLGDNRDKDDEQLALLERALGLKVAGVGDGKLLFVFTLIDPAKPSREFSFLVDVTDQMYRVPRCDPPIAMGELVQQLNEDRDLSAFIKRVRAAFVAYVSR